MKLIKINNTYINTKYINTINCYSMQTENFGSNDDEQFETRFNIIINEGTKNELIFGLENKEVEFERIITLLNSCKI